jgi:hypothetical protein
MVGMSTWIHVGPVGKFTDRGGTRRCTLTSTRTATKNKDPVKKIAVLVNAIFISKRSSLVAFLQKTTNLS